MDGSTRLPSSRRDGLDVPEDAFVTSWADIAGEDESEGLPPPGTSGDEENFVTPWSRFEDVTINITNPNVLVVELEESPARNPRRRAATESTSPADPV